VTIKKKIMAKASKEKKLVPNEDDKGLKMSMKKGDDKSKSRVPLQKKVKAPTIENYKENVIIDGLSAVDPFKPLIRLFSWNINGARALVKKEDSVEFYQNVIHHPEFCTIGLQEIKCDDKSLPAEIDCTEWARVTLLNTIIFLDNAEIMSLYLRLHTARRRKGIAECSLYLKLCLYPLALV